MSQYYRITFRQNGRTKVVFLLPVTAYGEEESEETKSTYEHLINQIKGRINAGHVWNSELIIEIRGSDYKPTMLQKLGRLFR